MRGLILLSLVLTSSLALAEDDLSWLGRDSAFKRMQREYPLNNDYQRDYEEDRYRKESLELQRRQNQLIEEQNSYINQQWAEQEEAKRKARFEGIGD